MEATAQTRVVGVPAAAPQSEVLSFPSHDAVAQILPLYLQNDLQQDLLQEQSDHTSDLTGAGRFSLCAHVEGPSSAPLPAAHAQEVQRYRGAMRRMAGDLLSLRAQVEALQTENSLLHSHLASPHDPGLDLLRDSDLDVMTKTEMADRIASLSGKLSSEHSRRAAQTERIQQLQNQLIRKNDSEKELLKLKSLVQRPRRLEQEQKRMIELEATVLHQGKVIEKMEKAQQMYTISVRNKQHGNQGLAMTKARSEGEQKPAAESTGLRQEPHRAPTRDPISLALPPTRNKSGRDREALLADLKTMETRRLILEEQLEENSKLWGKQKQQMLIRLSEHRHGLDHMSQK